MICLALPARAFGQQPQMHHLYDAKSPPGAIGRAQVVQRGGPLSGYFQPIEVRSPSGALISWAVDGRFTAPVQPARAAALVGAVYRMKVTSIPEHEGQELYPTLEIIDRTYAPPGREVQFPIVIELSQEDMRLALSGRYVVRVIYLENPRQALPVRGRADEQEWLDAGDRDPLRLADSLGRPMAILRIGSRVPRDAGAPDAAFLYGCPPLTALPPPPPPARPLAGEPPQ